MRPGRDHILITKTRGERETADDHRSWAARLGGVLAEDRRRRLVIAGQDVVVHLQRHGDVGVPDPLRQDLDPDP